MDKFHRIEYKEEQLIGQGAEAKIFESTLFGSVVICKERMPKRYRNEGIDLKLRKERTMQEVRLLQACLDNEIPVPRVLDVDKSNWIIVLEKINGEPIKHIINQNTRSMNNVFGKIGKSVAKLHEADIIHGDLTTSNIIYLEDNTVRFIDFGLGFISTHIEDKAVDILVLKHTLESSHPAQYKNLFEAFMEGYSSNYDDANRIIKRLNVVEGRVRYRSH